MEGSLLGVETSLRRLVVLDEEEQKGELLRNMCFRFLDMLSPPSWLCIKDVLIWYHTWMYLPLGHLHTHFAAQITVWLTVRQDQGENNPGAPQPVELTVRVPLDFLKRPLHGPGGDSTRKELLPFVLIFERELFPRLTYMKNLITHIHESLADILMNNKNVIVYDPLPDNGNVSCPHRVLPPQTPHNYHLRPLVKRGIFDNPYAHMPGEQPCKDLGHDNLLELFGHNEERGLSTILLKQGT